MKRFLLIVLTLLGITVSSQTVTKRIFLLGNSVTDAINYNGFQSLAYERGYNHVWARHMIPGTILEGLWNNVNGPNGFTEAPYGFPQNAFTQYTWDCVSLQPFDRGLSADLTIIKNYANLIKSKSPDVQFYIYSRWPRCPSSKLPTDATLTADTWNQLWLGTYVGSYQTNETRKFFEDLLKLCRDTITSLKPALIVPVGEVFYELNKKMAAGSVPGYTKIWEVYSDGIHMKGIGSYIASCTYFATMYKSDPRGLSVPSYFGAIPSDVAAIIQQTVFDVVFSYAYSGATPADLVPVSGVTVTPATTSVKVLNSVQLSAVIAPSNAANKRVNWVSLNTGVATVDSKGKATGMSVGTANIVVKTVDGNFKDTCAVTVTNAVSGSTTSGTLASWDFGTITVSKDSVASTARLAGITATTPATMGCVGSGLKFQTSVNSLAGTQQTTMNLATSIAGNEYISFHITPDPGKLMTITSIKLCPKSQNVTRTFALFSSVKGFTPDLIIDSVQKLNSGQQFTIPITGHVNLSSEVEFRIYIYGNTNVYESVGLGETAGNDFVIDGSILSVTDATVPTAPTALKASDVRDNTLTLSWKPGTDNLSVWGYNVYNGAVKINTSLVKDTFLSVNGLTAGTTYTFSVKTVDFNGNESSAASLGVTTNRPPTAKMSATPLTGTAPLTVVFSSQSTDPDANDFILGFVWDFGDGSAKDYSNGPSHIFTKAGTYKVYLRVMDSHDSYSLNRDSATITVGAAANNAPVAKFTTSVLSGNVPLTVKFTSTSTDPDAGDKIASYLWTFGSGIANPTVAGPSVTFTKAGTYTVVLKVTDNSGATDTASAIITVLTVGLEADQNSIHVFPNPVTDILTIECTDYIMLALYNMNGWIQVQKDEKDRRIDMSGLPAGIYVLKVLTKNGEIFKRIVKQ